MSGLTKDQLRRVLVNHGVELPPSGAKKDDYVQLYEKYVAPVELSKGDFSSDDEDVVGNAVDTKALFERSMVVDGIDISRLNDDELFNHLKDLGAQVGPVVESTRKVYQKKLFMLLGGEVVESPSYNGNVSEEEFSDSEEEVVEEPHESRSSVVTESLKMTETMKTSPPPSGVTDIRRRILLSSGGENTQPSVIFDPERHTPSPRRSLRTVTSSSSETVTLHRFVNDSMRDKFKGELEHRHMDTNASSTSTSKISVCLRLLIKLLFLTLIIALILYFYQNNHSESPFKAVEQLARQALEAAVGEEAAINSEEEPGEPDAPAVEEEVPLVSQ